MKKNSNTTKSPTYALHRDLGYWRLTFNGQEAILKHEQGLSYVAWLMAHPGESIHALDLATRIAAMNGKQDGITEVIDPDTGRQITVESHSRIQERGLKLDDAQAMRRVLRRQAELEAYVEDEDNTDPEKEEAYRELIDLYDYEKTNGPRVRDGAQKAADAVGKATKRLHKHLSTAAQADGSPNRSLRAFGDHIYRHILIPSGRALCHGGVRPREGFGGFFVYDSPGAVRGNGLRK